MNSVAGLFQLYSLKFASVKEMYKTIGHQQIDCVFYVSVFGLSAWVKSSILSFFQLFVSMIKQFS